MSHSSGIGVSQQLQQTFGNALQNGDKRLIKVQIIDETLIDISSVPIGSSNYEEDFNKAVDLLEPIVPCYILYRLDSKNQEGQFQWVLFAYVPDKSKVKDKMMYSSTRANLKRQLGSNYFVNEIFGTVAKDFTKESYFKHIENQQSDAPLTQQELNLKEEMEQGVFVGGQSTYVHGVAFPVSQDVIESFNKMKKGSINYIQLVIHVEQEKINLSESKSIGDISGVGESLSKTEPRFHFYNWKHKHEGETLTSLVFIYSCPDGSNNTKSAPVKLRMLYSSSKANAQNIATNAGMEISAKLEVNSSPDVTEDVIRKLIHPEANQQQKLFNKPKTPGKGQRRLIK